MWLERGSSENDICSSFTQAYSGAGLVARFAPARAQRAWRGIGRIKQMCQGDVVLVKHIFSTKPALYY